MAGLSGSSPFATIGTKPFSRRRHHDMEDENNEFLSFDKQFHNQFVIQVDKEGLDKQVKEGIEHRLAQERALAEYEKWDLTRIAAMQKADDILKREKKISDMEIEKFWQEQQRDRVKRDHEEKTFLTSQNEKATHPFFSFFFQIGPFDRNRYLEQDLEPERNTAINLAINHERLYQEILANNKREIESKDYIDWVQRDIEARRRLHLKEEDVKRQIFERDNRIEFEQLKMNAEKLKQLIIAKTLLHLLSLHKHVAQFQTSS
ncbi:hypothetical protein CY35_03G008400 [Sphagnum magellanicum]|nr:hypothetical protein CY35_03G008400 [Sphagnum magellanicum]